MAGPRMMTFPLAIDVLGRVAFEEDPLQQLQNKVRMLVATHLGERVMQPRYGTNLNAYVFGFNDAAEEAAIQTEITNAMAQYLPEVTVLDVTTQSTDDSTLVVALDYSVPTTSSSDPTVFQAVIEIGGTVVGS